MQDQPTENMSHPDYTGAYVGADANISNGVDTYTEMTCIPNPT